ncbi:MAG TPA: hypothetical protein VH590_09990 [Ktedonobacterales bacterium]
MAKLLDQVRTRLDSANTDEQVEAARQLCDQREWNALPELLRLLAQDECGYSVAHALRAFGPEVCDQVGLLLLHEQKAVQYRAAWTLAGFNDQRAVKPMLAALSEPFFHEPFLPTLSRMGIPEFDRMLARELARHHQSTSHPSERFRAASFLWALTQMRSPAAADLAPHFTQDHHYVLVRQRAQRYLDALVA